MAGAVAKPDAAMGKSPARQARYSADIDARLAAVTAGRIKYADPRSLPSFPSSGLAPGCAAANAAASLGWISRKPVEPWKPERTTSASAAAAMANNYTMSPPREHAMLSDGHRAAMIAVGSAGTFLKQPSTKLSTQQRRSWGNSAAMQAFHTSRPASAEPTKVSHGSFAATQAFNINRSHSMKKTAAPSRQEAGKSLLAAQGAMSSRRRASTYSEIGVKDAHAAEASAAASALNGAVRAHQASLQAKPPLADVGAVSVTTMTRNMFTSHPPVKPEVDEQRFNMRMHQSALDMARKMYRHQQQMVDQTREAHGEETAAAPRSPFLNLQDAAYKQAQNRLSKLHDEHQQGREYQEYYGNETTPRRKFSMTNKLRRRSSENDALNDRERSRKIREQMSIFSTKLSQVDNDKRERDREALLATAQRNVKARLQDMDKDVYHETARARPTSAGEWERKVQQAAQLRHNTGGEKKGQVDVGGGKYVSQEEVDAIATKRVQPVLDDINAKAEAELARQAVLKFDKEEKREDAEKRKYRDREIREVERKTKELDRQDERSRKLQEKREERVKKGEARAAKAEQKRAVKEKRRSKQDSATANHSQDDERSAGVDENLDVGSAQRSPVHPRVETAAGSASAAQLKAELAISPTSKVKGWIKTHFSRGKSISESNDKRGSFSGGAAMRDYRFGMSSSPDNRSTSMRDVAIAGKDDGSKSERTDADKQAAGREWEHDSYGESPISPRTIPPFPRGGKLENNVDEEEVRHSPSISISIEAPKSTEDEMARKSRSPARDSRFREEMDK
ncbi:hypothetical protein RJ55_07011 [Drechmeria coniospora]|nr:hypothetical protein RJ55_07011 [Drechmeria coniospora]